MFARDLFGGVASHFLMLAKIILCLLFAVYDRLIEVYNGSSGGAVSDESPAVPALET